MSNGNAQQLLDALNKMKGNAPAAAQSFSRTVGINGKRIFSHPLLKELWDDGIALLLMAILFTVIRGWLVRRGLGSNYAVMIPSALVLLTLAADCWNSYRWTRWVCYAWAGYTISPLVWGFIATAVYNS